jgi:hypothetical protein
LSGTLRSVVKGEVKPHKAFTFLNTSDNKKHLMHLYRHTQS